MMFTFLCAGKLRGLLGNYNGVKNDDFQPRHGPPIAVTSNMSDVHYLFGMTCRCRMEDFKQNEILAIFMDEKAGLDPKSFLPV